MKQLSAQTGSEQRGSEASGGRAGSTASRPHRLTRLAALLACGTLTAGLAGSNVGCNSINPLEIKSFIDPGELGRYKQDTLQLKILDHVDQRYEEVNSDFATAVEPTQEDLVANAGDYQISRNDVLNIQIGDLNGPGTSTAKEARVSETGNISLPFLDAPIHAEGLTESDLERTIVDRYRSSSIIQKAQVSVVDVEPRGKAFSILGQVARPAQYAIVEQNFRVLDALTIAGDTQSPLLEDLYIIRRVTPSGASGAAPAAPETPGTPTRPTSGPDELAPRGALQQRNPGLAMAGLKVGGLPLAGRGVAGNVHAIRLDAGDVSPAAPSLPDTAPATPVSPASPAAPLSPAAPAGSEIPAGPAPASPAAPIDLAPASKPAAVDPLAPGAVPAAPANPPAAAPAAPSDVAPAVTPAAAPPAAGAAGTGGASAKSGFEGFHALVPPTDVKIIHIPLLALKSGQLQYNIVVRPHDQIIVQPLASGVYYMGGHVQNPGAYTLTGAKVTLKEAVIAAHMLDQLAIPQRTDIIRRINGKDQEIFVRIDLDKIFAGHEPDIYLKPNDSVMVGTNLIAPFLSAVRGAFRITYGFGFLYDRNFAVNSNTGAVQ